MTAAERRILMLLRWYGPVTDDDLIALWRHIRRQGIGDEPGDWGELTPSRLRTIRASLVHEGKAKASTERGRSASNRPCHQWEAVG